MALTIANNVSSLMSQNNLTRSNSALKTSLERLSSGFKVNRGADGPAALVISEKQRTQIAGLRQAIDNSEKAVAMIQTAEGALNEINSLLVKVRSLALDSANSGVNDNDALAANQAEIDNAIDTINRIAENTQFTTKKLLDGSSGISGTPTDDEKVTFLQATSDTKASTHQIAVTTAAERAIAVAGTEQTAALAQDETLTINGTSVELFKDLTKTQVRDRINDYTSQTGVIADLDPTTDAVRLYSTEYGANASIEVVSNRVAAVDSSGFGIANVKKFGVDIVADIAGESFNGKGNVVTADSGEARGLTISVAASDTDPAKTFGAADNVGSVTIVDKSLIFQIGPNHDQTAKVAIAKAHSGSLGIGVEGNQFTNLEQIDVTSGSKAQDALQIIDAAVDDITNLRGALGAFQQNTLESTANNLRTTLENTINAESVIRDTDFAAEISEFTKQQVLLQAGTTVLGNANQIPQLVLSLLG